jgi:hypothetical protein
MFLFFFFSLAQVLILLYLKKHPNFSESKWTFLLLEAIVIFATISWYLLSKPQPKPIQPVKKLEPVKQIPKEPVEKNTEQISALEEAISHLTQAEESSKNRIQELEQEKDGLQEKLLQEEALQAQAVANIEQYGPLVFNLSLEIEKLSSHIEELKRQHDIELRACLGKKPRPPSKAPTFRPPTSPLASTLLLLVQCQKGLSLQQGAWPAQEHALLVRRKFFDLVSSYSSTPFAIVSLSSPSDYFLSPKLPESCSLSILHSLIGPHTKTVSTLRPFEPYFISDKNFSLVSFRIAWENLDDLIVLVPSGVTG